MANSRSLIAAAAVAGLLAGVALSHWWRPAASEAPAAAPTSTPAARDASSLEAQLAELESALDEERSLRGALEIKLELLRQKLGEDEATQPAAGREAASRTADAAAGAARTEAEDPHAGAAADQEWFDSSSLVARGVDEHDAARLDERFQELQMQELYLRDQASREGWLGRPRYGSQLQALRDELRAEIGERDYDLLLWGARRNNRVILADVLGNSPAGAAGVKPGDVLQRYDGRPIYSGGELLEAIRAARPGTTVPLDLLRDGERLRVYVPTGPLGVKLAATRVFPSD